MSDFIKICFGQYTFHLILDIHGTDNYSCITHLKFHFQSKKKNGHLKAQVFWPILERDDSYPTNAYFPS